MMVIVIARLTEAILKKIAGENYPANILSNVVNKWVFKEKI